MFWGVLGGTRDTVGYCWVLGDTGGVLGTRGTRGSVGFCWVMRGTSGFGEILLGISRVLGGTEG